MIQRFQDKQANQMIFLTMIILYEISYMSSIKKGCHAIVYYYKKFFNEIFFLFKFLILHLHQTKTNIKIKPLNIIKVINENMYFIFFSLFSSCNYSPFIIFLLYYISNIFKQKQRQQP